MTSLEYLGIMQPYYFPAASHFSLYYACKEWVIFDLPQFKKKSFITRNYFQGPAGVVSTISAEVSSVRSNSKVYEIQLLNKMHSRETLLGNIRRFKKFSKYSGDMVDLVSDVFDSSSDSLVDLNEQILLKIASYIGFERKTIRASSIQGSETWSVGATEWAPLICRHLDFDSYLNPTGGRSFLNNEVFAKSDVGLYFHEYKGVRIPTQFQDKVIQDLSIINHLLRWGPQAVLEQLERYSISSS
jgi:hypothetical protein